MVVFFDVFDMFGCIFGDFDVVMGFIAAYLLCLLFVVYYCLCLRADLVMLCWCCTFCLCFR